MNKKQIDWTITLLPLGIVVALSILFFFMPEQSNAVLSQIRFFFGDQLGLGLTQAGSGRFHLRIILLHHGFADTTAVV